MGPVITDLEPPRTTWSLVDAVLVATAVVVFAVVGWSATRVPNVIDSVSVDNPTAFIVDVDVGAPDDGAWLSLGTIDERRSYAFEQVTDQGSRWVFRFSYAGVHAGEVEVSRADLEANGWQVTVPPVVGERLSEAGFDPQPRRSDGSDATGDQAPGETGDADG